MPDQEQSQTASPSEGMQKPENMIPQTRFNEVLERAKQAEERLSQLAQAERQKQEAEAIAKGEHEKIIAELRPKAERAAQLESTFNSFLEAELSSISEEQRQLFEGVLEAIPTPEGKLIALKNLQRLTPSPTAKPPAPTTDAGAGRRQEVGTSASADDIAWAQKLGISIEAYMNQKRKE